MQWKLAATESNEVFPIDTPRWCGHNLELLDIETDDLSFATSTHQGLWKFSPMIPLNDAQNIVSFGEGFTPIILENIHGKNCLLKLEYLFPTGSYKDRGATVLVSKIKELGIRKIVEDSSGNAGSAIAAYAAKAGIECEIVVAATTSPAKISQLKAYGALVTLVDGDRQKVAGETLKKAAHTYYASHSWNPFFFQGTKTFAYEVVEQCNYSLPDTLVLPVGNGTLLIGAYLGFSELVRLGKTTRIPRIIAVQASHCPGLDTSDSRMFLPTIAEGIAVKNPVRKKQILEVIRKTNGKILNIREKEIKTAVKEAALRGYYIEKTSAIAWAAASYLDPNDLNLIPLTGSGLKNS